MKSPFPVMGFIVGTTALGQELEMSRVAAWKRIENGSISAFRVGNAYLIPVKEVRRVRREIQKEKGAK